MNGRVGPLFNICFQFSEKISIKQALVNQGNGCLAHECVDVVFWWGFGFAAAASFGLDGFDGLGEVFGCVAVFFGPAEELPDVADHGAHGVWGVGEPAIFYIGF